MADLLVTTLNVEPGEYRSRYARWSAALSPLLMALNEFCTNCVSWTERPLGLNVGFEYMASTAPLVRSSATTDPRWFASASRAAVWAVCVSVRITLLVVDLPLSNPPMSLSCRLVS